jgi:5'(3')-deoxyribonucleotidase
MKMNKFFLAMVAISIVSITACKKYPDGPLISFHTKTERVANNWKVAQALDNGSDVTSDYNKYELDLSKNGGASLTAKYRFLGTDYDFVTTGNWVFVSNKEKIAFDFNNNDADGVYQILKLEEDEMWLKKDGGTLELHFVTQ